MRKQKYVPALSVRWLTPLYDTLVEGPMSFARMRKSMLAQMGDLSHKRILDVGSGTGTMLLMIKQAYPNADVVGLDGDPQVLEIARAKARTLGLEIQFDHGMAFELPYPDESFDVVLTSMMLHHLLAEDKRRTAKEMYRMLRLGGRLLGADFAAPRSGFGKALRPITRRLERVADNVDGLLPLIFRDAGFSDYVETQRYFLGSIALFQGSKP
jgi:ubiquinone/menaquinone biosynthesis C-methylase UbiE